MEYEKLCRAVERELHREMRTPQDFDYLSEQVMKRLSESVSTTTLMRLWGYRPSVKTRYSTLDILSRFIGFEDYTQFLAAQPSESDSEEHLEACDVQDAPSPALSVSVGASGSRHRWRWVVLLVLVVAVGMGAAYFFYPSHHTVPQPVFLDSLGQVSNNRQYYIHTRHDQRGLLGINSHQLASTYDEARHYRCDTASTFALIRYEDSFYLYSVLYRRFINVLLAATDDPLRPGYVEKGWCAIDLHIEEEHFVIDFWDNHDAGRVFTLNVNGGNGLIITDWGTMNGVYDDGNLFRLEDAGPFDPSEALQMLRQSREKNAATPAGS